MYRLKSPLSAQLELTEACNNACLHCYNYWRYEETGQRLDSDSLLRDFDHFEHILDCLAEQEVRTVTFTGGEPFIRQDLLFDLIKAAKVRGLRVGVNTNGALIDSAGIEQLKDSGTDFLLVSLLSNDPATHNEIAHSHSHHRTTEAISLLAASGLNIAVNMVVSSHNWDMVRSTAMYVKDLGINEFSATPVLPCPLASTHHELLLSPRQVVDVLDSLLWVSDQKMMVDVLEPLVHCMFNPEERQRFARFLNHRSCSAGISDVVISPDGDVRPCILAMETYGNLFTDGWKTCWSNLSSWCSSDLLPAECLECESVDSCGGGCRVAAQAISGNMDGKDPYMREPLTDTGAIEQDSEESLRIAEDTVLVFPQGTSLREEAFGCVLFCGRSFMFLDQDGFRLVSYLRNQKSFSSGSIMRDINIDTDELIEFVSVLANRGFLAPNPL